MSVFELTKTQLTRLKETYYTEKHDRVSYDELVCINDIVSDEEIYSEYSGTNFVDDDFWG